MEIAEAEVLCRRLIGEYLGSEWAFRWDRALRRFGVCRWDERVISLSSRLVELNEIETVRDAVLHEIAHGLAPRRAGHGPEWRRIAQSIGARPAREIDGDVVCLPPPRYLGRCPSCGREILRAHRKRRVACRGCCMRFSGGRYSPSFELAWEPAPHPLGANG